MGTKITPEEREKIIAMYTAMDPNRTDRYSAIAKHFNRSTSAVFNVIKKSTLREPEIKYFNPKEPQF